MRQAVAKLTWGETKLNEQNFNHLETLSERADALHEKIVNVIKNELAAVDGEHGVSEPVFEVEMAAHDSERTTPTFADPEESRYSEDFCEKYATYADGVLCISDSLEIVCRALLARRVADDVMCNSATKALSFHAIRARSFMDDLIRHHVCEGMPIFAEGDIRKGAPLSRLRRAAASHGLLSSVGPRGRCRERMLHIVSVRRADLQSCYAYVQTDASLSRNSRFYPSVWPSGAAAAPSRSTSWPCSDRISIRSWSRMQRSLQI